MAKRNYKYSATTDLSNLVFRKENYIDWKKSIGKIIPFTFDNNKLSEEFLIVDYKIPEGKTHYHVYLQYNGIMLKPILPIGIKKATLSNVLDGFYIDWKYEIGNVLMDNKRSIKIINRSRFKDSQNMSRKYYKIYCLKCGFDSGEHYINGEYRNEYWVSESDLARTDNRRIDCPCCGGKIIVVGINDITTTAPWMINYFQGGADEARKYTKYSNTPKLFKCIHCNRLFNKSRKISDLYINNRLACICSDHVSYPNKFAYYLFEQIKNQYIYYENEYSPDWAGQYRYDNYIETKNGKYIIEMDGGLGHGRNTFSSDKKDIKGLTRDKIKDDLAKNHDIILIRIDCVVSQMDYIKSNIINKLSAYFDFNFVNWEMIDIKAKTKNTYKEICDFFNKHHCFESDICKELNFSKKVVSSALKVGNQVGWCNFQPCNRFKEDVYREIIDYWNKNKYIQTSVLSQKFKTSQSTVVSYLKLASENGLCDYNPNTSIISYHKNRSYPVYVFDLKLDFIKEYKSSLDCAENSLNDFNVKFNKRNIDYVCNGKAKQHKGYYFSREFEIDKGQVLRKINSDNHVKKKVYVYSRDHNLCENYASIKELCSQSIVDFGIQFTSCNVASVCTGRHKQHKGYIFSHTPIIDKMEELA